MQIGLATLKRQPRLGCGLLAVTKVARKLHKLLALLRDGVVFGFDAGPPMLHVHHAADRTGDSDSRDGRADRFGDKADGCG